jgi:hypothetical protein
MEILDMKFAGIPIAFLIIGIGLWYGVLNIWREWKKQQVLKKELDDANRVLHEKFRWEPDMSTGSDQGKWVPKDGLPD